MDLLYHFMRGPGSTIFRKYATVKRSIETFLLVVSPKQTPFIRCHSRRLFEKCIFMFISATKMIKVKKWLILYTTCVEIEFDLA